MGGGKVGKDGRDVLETSTKNTLKAEGKAEKIKEKRGKGEK